MKVGVSIAFVFLLTLFISCQQQKSDKLFELIDPEYSGIVFSNDLEYTEQLNPYTFKNFFNGGGVGLADFNNDGLVDVFLCGNLVSNKLYINQGNFRFIDATEAAGLSSKGIWTTGVSICDINGDGFQDIYVCKSGPPGGEKRYNELFLNNGDLTFTESSKSYGLDFIGLSTHAAFFDFDKDGDLDCYLLNNSIRSIGGYDLIPGQRNIPDSIGGNKLLKNMDGHFKDVSTSAGIYTSSIGFGLGVTIGDINGDYWDDIYVSNDFFERDYLYINNQDGTFRESLEEFLTEISMGSMGADLADINNDGKPEIFVTEMLPHTDDRLKTKAQFESWDRYQFSVRNGYFNQFGRNVLQLNNGVGPDGKTSFSEISRLAGVEATEWSWGALIFDMDNDGLKDIFVSNGIYKDLLDQDYINFIANQDVVRNIILKKGNVIKQLIDSIPSSKLSNFAFHNQGQLKFDNTSREWGLDLPSYSNGSAYADLDNDGDLDLVINNVSSQAFVFKNQSNQILSNNWIQVKLIGSGKNSKAIGSKVTVYSNGSEFFIENNPMRGFESTVDTRLSVGLGKIQAVDSLVVTWPDNSMSVIRDPKINSEISVHQDQSASRLYPMSPGVKGSSIFRVSDYKIPFKHSENDFVDFDRDRLLFNMISNEGPCLCQGDINSDGQADIYVGGAKGQPGKLYIQKANGNFVAMNDALFEKDKDSEDTDCVFFDANGDRKIDLYVASGGNEYSSNSFPLVDRLYFNAGGGQLRRSEQILPTAKSFVSSSAVKISDFDGDGDIDLFVGGRLKPLLYGVPADSYILRNNGYGIFEDVTATLAPDLISVGQVTDARWVDINTDGTEDLVLVGEWMPIKMFVNDHGKLVDRTKEWGFDLTNGWYHCVEMGDFNNDGMPDLFTGNFGVNSRFKAAKEKPLTLYVNDFDRNGTVEQIVNYYSDGRQVPMVLKQDLVQQIPSLKKKYLRFSSYRDQTMEDIFSENELLNSVIVNAYMLESAVWINRGDHFEMSALPIETQFSPVYAAVTNDFDHDGNSDILLGGNLCRAKPETGIYNASFGLMLRGQGNGRFVALSSAVSGIQVRGEIRDLLPITISGSHNVLIGLNNENVRVIKY